MNTTNPAGARLRELARQGTIQVPGAPHALAGRLIEQMGFSATYLSGAAFSASVLALPDVGLFSLTELAQHTTQLTRACNLPVIVDADTGFGETVNVERTVNELEAAGAAAIQLEDQQLPKRCGHLSGKQLIETSAMVSKLRAATGSRASTDTILLVRTDARGVDGFAAAVERALRYVDAGADWIFPEALANVDEFRDFAKKVSVPLVANMTEFGVSPLLTITELTASGYAAVLYPVTLLRTAMRAMQGILETIRNEGTQERCLSAMQTRQELYDLLRYAEFDERDRSYFS